MYQPTDDGTAEKAQERLNAALAAKYARVPFGATRWATAGETCTCGAPALVVYEGGHQPVGFCGVSNP